ncbi:MAG: hypothetical protein M1519_07255 [Actinobacteria bacterium]|jgi:hypothetical protein|nr:hypothetical protein [Actinomycetota bacterium]
MGMSGAIDSEIAKESESFLSGNYLEYFISHHSAYDVPPWAWLNVLAHGSVVQLEELVAKEHLSRHQVNRLLRHPERSKPTPQGWNRIRTALAQALLQTTKGDEEYLRYIQTNLLIPLEDRFCTIHPFYWPSSPWQLLQQVSKALYRSPVFNRK